MWLTLIFAILLCLVVLYVPGYMVARAFSIGKFASVAIAPLFSVFVVTVLGIALYELSFVCTGVFLFALALALCLIVLLIAKGTARIFGSEETRELLAVEDPKSAWKTAALYLAASVAMVCVVYLLAIDGPDSFSRNDDTTVHLSVVRAYLDTGTFSTLHASSFLDQGGSGSFYPAAWHVVVSIVASFFGDAVTIAMNAAIIAFTAFVFPLAMCLLAHIIFNGNRQAVLAGALFVLAFCGFPWGFLVFGQLLPNMIAFMFVPLTLILLMGAIDAPRTSGTVKLSLAVAVGLAVIALCQPNAAFTFGIWAVLYCLSRIFYLPHAEKPRITPKSIAAAAGLLVAACGVWAAMYLAPFMQSVVQYTWPATLSPIEAIVSGPLFMFTVREGVQPFLSIVVLAGILHTFRNRRHLWLSVAYVFALALYIISVSTDGMLKQVLSGFWYTDYYRTGAMTALFAIPLAALGFAQLLKIMQSWFQRTMGSQAGRQTALRLSLGILLVLFVVCQFAPVHVRFSEKRDIYLGLVNIQNELSARYSWNNGLTDEEDAFVRKAMEVIPEGALVINVPSDGSCWSYGVEGINVYYRRSSDTGGREAAKENELLRTRLCDISTSEEVQQAIRNLDARYVLILDDVSGTNRTTSQLRYSPENWKGIESIDDQTPGFTLVLSEDDMRLYEIDR